MKFLFLILLIFFVIGCGAQPETDPAINIPADSLGVMDDKGVNAPDLNAGINRANQNICRTNMLSAAAMITIYEAQYGTPPATFEESGANVSCPSGGAYIYSTDRQSWTIECPAHSSHGSITDGVASW